MYQFDAAQQTSTAKLPVLFQIFKKIVLALRVKIDINKSMKAPGTSTYTIYKCSF